MIVKALSKKSPMMFRRLVEYFQKDPGLPGPEGHNLLVSPDDQEKVIREFEKNYHAHHRRHRGGIVCMHEVIAPHPADAKAVTPEILYDLARHYQEWRSPNAIGFYQVHLQADGGKYRPHIHLLLSGNELGSEKQISQRKQSFQAVKDKLKEYTMKKYPELIHAFKFDHGHQKKFLAEQSQRRHNEIQMVKRIRSLKEKERLAKLFREALRMSTDSQSLEKMLLNTGMKIYRRGDRNGVGIITLNNEGKEGRRYRLKTIDVQIDFEEQQKRWELENEKGNRMLRRKQELTQIKKLTLKPKL